MSSNSRAINSKERAAFRHLVLTHLNSVDDLRLALEDGELDRAERLGREFGDDLRLMEDLGWDENEAAVELTMAPDQLLRTLSRTRKLATEVKAELELETSAGSLGERSHQVIGACDRILAETGA